MARSAVKIMLELAKPFGIEIIQPAQFIVRNKL